MFTMRCLIFVAMLALCRSLDEVEKRIKSAQTLDGLIHIATDEIKGKNSFISATAEKYNTSVETNQGLFHELKARYQSYLNSSPWKCILYKWHYKWALDRARKTVNQDKNSNVTQDINKNYAAEIGQLEKSFEKIKEIQSQSDATADEKKKKELLNDARNVVLDAHASFYGEIRKHMDNFLNEFNATMIRLRGTMTKRGNRLMKCAL